MKQKRSYIIKQCTHHKTLMAPNKMRIGGTIYNNSNSQLYIKFGKRGSIHRYDYNLVIFPYDCYELASDFIGIITGKCNSSGSGILEICEYSQETIKSI